jgi:hypothetical protein
MNRRSPKLSRLLHQLCGLITTDPGSVRRRDLEEPSHSEVQLELSLGWNASSLRHGIQDTSIEPAFRSSP